MAEGISMAEGAKRVRAVAGDYICPVCGTKVIGGDHNEAECSWVAQQKKILGKSGGITVMA